MQFNSFEYILLLWTSYVLFWTLRNRRPLRHTLLLVASYWFYGQVGVGFLGLLIASTLLDYGAGLGIEAAALSGNPRRKQLWMAASLCGNLGMLGFFKYWDFFARSTAFGLGRIGVQLEPWILDVALPAGISFYTFQTLSYTLDIYRGSLKPVRSLLDFAVYVSFFPQLIAGPIVRAADFLPQLEKPPVFRREQVASGLFQFLRGLCKKLLMADILGKYLVDQAFAGEHSLANLGAPALLLVTYAYALQLYGDFAGYSDMAIGSARVLGFELCKNFDAPFKSRSLEEFWTRWHISMSSWFMDYVYKSMGGSRVAWLRGCWNVLVAWTLVGLWHGASWTFVLWGAYHGLWLVLVRSFRLFVLGRRNARGERTPGSLPDSWLTNVLGTLFAFHVVAFSMILFRCKDLATFRVACTELLHWDRPWPFLTEVSKANALGKALDPALLSPSFEFLGQTFTQHYWLGLQWQLWLVLLLGYVTHFLPERVLERTEARWIRAPLWLQGLVLLLAVYVFFGLHPPGLAPFIYFQF